MRYSKKLLLCILAFTLTLLVVSGCNGSGKESSKKASSSLYEVVRPLLETVHKDNTFVFEEIPWLISKEGVIQQKQLTGIQIDDIDRLLVKGKLPLDDSIQQHIIYNFEENQLVSGAYLFITSEKELFDELGLAVKDVIQESFPEPRSTNFNTLDSAAASAEKNESIMWQGSDKSYMWVNMLTNESSELILQIQIASPIEQISLQR